MSQAQEIQSILEQYGAAETTTYEYDNLDQLIRLVISGGDITEITYTYEGYNRKTEEAIENGVKTKSRTYTYDETDWLTQVVDDTDGNNSIPLIRI